MSEVGLLLPGWPESPQTARPNPAGRKFKIMKEWSKRADWPAPEQRLGKEMWRERGREIERERERERGGREVNRKPGQSEGVKRNKTKTK